MAKEQRAVFGGGCFWCMEAVFQRLTGVTHVESGYMGGGADQATYRQVCGGDTGHVEVVRVTFDPDQINYRGRGMMRGSNIAPSSSTAMKSSSGLRRM